MIEMHTQAQRCRMYFGRNWLEKIDFFLRPEHIVPQTRLGAPSRPNILSQHVRHQLVRMARG